jgi:hypothetical protein
MTAPKPNGLFVLVCGGRDYRDRDALFECLDSLHKKRKFCCVIQGGAKGADRLAVQWGLSRDIHVVEVAALWSTRGKRAGMDRNRAMLMLKPDVVLAFPGGVGTEGMVRIAREAGIPIVRCPRPASEGEV